MEIKVKLTQIFKSSLACWQHLNMACPQHDPTNGVVNPNTSHETIKIKAMVTIEKLPPLFLTQVITSTLSPCFVRTSLTYEAMAFPKIYMFQKNQWSHGNLPLVIQKMHNENKCIYYCL
jgi:hypothetical protein